MNAWPKHIGEYKLNKADAQSAFYLRQIGALSFYHALDVEIRHANSNPNLTLLHVARLTGNGWGIRNQPDQPSTIQWCQINSEFYKDQEALVIGNPSRAANSTTGSRERRVLSLTLQGRA